MKLWSQWIYGQGAATTRVSHFNLTKSTKDSRSESAKRQVNCTSKTKGKSCFKEAGGILSPLLVIPHYFFFQRKDLVLKKKKKKERRHGFQWMPVRIKQAIHAASWFRHASLHTNQPSPGLASHSLVCHSNTRWRQCQKFQLKYPFVMSVQEKKKEKENKDRAFSIA